MEVARRLAQIRLDRVDPHLGSASLTINRIRSLPDSTHTVQASCDLTIDRRLVPGEEPDEAFAQIEATARQVDGQPDPASGKPFRVEVKRGPFMYPSLVAPDAPVVQDLAAACREALGAPPRMVYAPNAFDQGYLNHIGIPTVNWGCGEARYAHTDLDMASVERTRDAALVYAIMMFRILT
jgi:acetylornithine deacetylase/succinyl-diaminopimelate desuccinylase-like protein